MLTTKSLLFFVLASICIYPSMQAPIEASSSASGEQTTNTVEGSRASFTAEPAAGLNKSAVGVSQIGEGFSNIAGGSKDVAVGVGEAAGEKLADARDAAVAAGETVAEAAVNASVAVADTAKAAKDKAAAAAQVVGNKTLEGAQAVGNAAVVAKDAVVDAGITVKDKAVNISTDVAQGAKDVAVGTGNVVGGGLVAAGQAIQSDDHPEERAAEALAEGTAKLRDSAAEFRKNAEERSQQEGLATDQPLVVTSTIETPIVELTTQQP